MKQTKIQLVMTLVLVLPSAALAVDGVILIDQNKALAGGVTVGDAPGFPISITQSGSYRLASNLTAPANTGAISITANNVTLDLNGFSVSSTIVDVGIFGLVNTIFIGAADVSIKNGSVILTGTTIMGQGGNAIVSFFGGPATRVTLRDLSITSSISGFNSSISMPSSAAILQSNFINWITVVGQFSVVQNNSFFVFQNNSVFTLQIFCPSVISGNAFVASGIGFQNSSATCSQSNNAFQ
jgi:hypothetical protein